MLAQPTPGGPVCYTCDRFASVPVTGSHISPAWEWGRETADEAGDESLPQRV